MQQMIDELKAVPGVVGAGIYSVSDGLLVSNLPGIFKPDRLAVVGKHLGKLYSAGRHSFADLADVTLNYDESVIVVRELDKYNLVFAFCDPSYNHNLLSMSLNLMQEEYQAGNFKTEVAVVVPAEKESPAEQSAAPRLEGPLASLFEVLRERLSKVLGPMANIIFDEAVESWQQAGVADFSRIEELIGLLNKEIADEDKVDKYRSLIEPELQGFQKG